jgi:hypothetical protein
MIDITDLIIENIKDPNGINPIVSDIGKFTVMGVIEIKDQRIFKGPEYNSPDGLPEYSSGDIEMDIDLSVIDGKGTEQEFTYNIELIKAEIQ